MKKKWFYFCFTFLLCLPVYLLASTWQLGDLYSDQELDYWQKKYQDNIQWNFDNLILARLTHAERKKLGNIKLNFPLRAEGKLRNNPIQFYAMGHTIHIPVLSVRFFDEITQAWGYLLSNNGDMKLVSDYLAMIRNRDPADFPGGRFPAPLDALNIPKDAWKHDNKMDDISQKALKSAIVWILAHELAHIYYQHPGYGPELTRIDAQKNEAQADQFASQITRRIGLAPVGIVQYFMVMAHMEPGLSDFKNNEAWQHYLKTEATHPLTASRLTAIAQELNNSPQDFTSEEMDQKTAIERMESISNQILAIGAILSNPKMHQLLVVAGLSTDLQSLRQKSSVVPVIDQKVSCLKDESQTPFHGQFDGTYTRYLNNGQNETLPIHLLLYRSGNRVVGRFNFSVGEGSLSGRIVQGKQMLYDWQWGNTRGQGLFEISESGWLLGQWGYDRSAKDGGTWKLCRKSL